MSTQRNGPGPLRVLLLTTPRSYRLDAFRRAAAGLGIEVITGLDIPPELAEQWPEAVALRFRIPETAVETIVTLAQAQPLAAILAVDDSGSVLAAAASAALGLPHNSPDAASAARDKHLMRQMLRRGGVATPHFQAFRLYDDADWIAAQVAFPAVVKPVDLNGSRGVMRVNDSAELISAVHRLRRMLGSDESQPAPRFLVEEYIPGIEVAVEGLLDEGQLHILALFDKPDPLEGPFFEETIYVTPSRLAPETQQDIARTTMAAAKALGLSTGPVHAELRINDAGSWIVEVAGRSIGGLCSEVLRFGVAGSLEELILRQACGMPLELEGLPEQASGVMMIPIPEAGLLRSVEGVAAAQAVPLIERVEITAPLNYLLTPLPEGDSYLGFIFARGSSPAEVERALRRAHAELRFGIDPVIELTPI